MTRLVAPHHVVLRRDDSAHIHCQDVGDGRSRVTVDAQGVVEWWPNEDGPALRVNLPEMAQRVTGAGIPA